jgi:hypothetical protein
MKGLLHRLQVGHIKSTSLSAFLDSALSGSEHQRVSRHVAECTRCREDTLALQQTIQLLHSIPEVPVPRPFTLVAPVVVIKPDLSRVRRVPLMAAAAMAVALMAVVVSDGFGLIGPNTQQTVIHHLAMEEQVAVVRMDSSGGPARPISMDADTSRVDKSETIQSAVSNIADPTTPSGQSSVLDRVGYPFDLWMIEASLFGVALLLGIAGWAVRHPRSTS